MNARILLVGKVPEIMDAVADELRDLGLDITGSTEPDAVFDARAFDVAAFGGGLRGPSGDRIKRDLLRANPALRVLDVQAPTAAHQVATALEGASDPDAVDLAAYCARIGYAGPLEPTLDVLRALIAHHIAAIAFESFDVLTGKGVDVAPTAVDAKLIGARRGGYCFEQNGLFRRVLKTIGFDVEPLLGRVRWMLAPGAPPSGRTHMVLRVMLDGRPWLADVGFGSAVPTSPLRLDATAPQKTVHETYRIIPFGGPLLLQAEVAGRWMPVYQIDPSPVLEIDWVIGNWFTATHPSSHFRHRLIAARSTPEARHVLLENRLTIRPAGGGAAERRYLDADGIEQALADIFGLPVEPGWRAAIERAAQAPRA